MSSKNYILIKKIYIKSVRTTRLWNNPLESQVIQKSAGTRKQKDINSAIMT